ncbi:S24 family peptidase [Sphingomonas sp. 1P06PA]|uniref:S24 family peptidase n=1 Tax=Sphingomonas sp. 1P06PA TaxID=554121 RepID=UPI0039A77842
MDPASARSRLEALIRDRREDYAGLSRLLGRNPAYLHQYVRRGSPRVLAEGDRRTLADYFGIDESELGGPPGPAPLTVAVAGTRSAAADLLLVPRLAVTASAGPGSVADAEARAGRIAFDAGWLRGVARNGTGSLSAIRVAGDSMEPTLSDGDELLVDTAPDARRIGDGIFVLRREDALIVKRLQRDPGDGRVAILSDNPAYPPIPGVDPARLDIVGRAVWAGRRLR